MIPLNLTTKTREQELIKNYLEDNVSQTLSDKINNGVPAEKDGKPLISKKNLEGFFSFASEEARKLVDKNARSACVKDSTVYGWAIHYFEEDSILGTLFYIDGTEFKEKPKAAPAAVTTPKKAKVEMKSDYQFSLFDMAEDNPTESDKQVDTPTETDTDDELENAMRGQIITEDGEIIDYEDFDGDIEEVINEIPNVQKKPAGSPLYQRYKRVQNAYPNSIITLRLGDFYEFFEDNANIVANEFDLTLTGRDMGLEKRVPMCGIPYHASDNYFNKIRQNYNLVIVESDDDKKTQYLPKYDKKPDISINYATGIISTLQALFGAELEVK